jgi:hypothetical protein
VVVGDSTEILEELKIAVSMNLPIIVVKGTPFTDTLIEFLAGNQSALPDPSTIYHPNPQALSAIVTQGHFYPIESNIAED